MSSAAALSDDVDVSLGTVSISFFKLEKHSRPGNIRSVLRLPSSGPTPSLELGDAVLEYLVATQHLRQKVCS